MGREVGGSEPDAVKAHRPRPPEFAHETHESSRKLRNFISVGAVLAAALPSLVALHSEVERGVPTRSVFAVFPTSRNP